MNLSKNQIVMLAIGGVALVASAVLGYLAFSAYSAKSEAADASESDSAAVRALLGAAISPDTASIAAVKKNSDALAGWTEAALSTASAGDRAVEADVNEAAFKQKLVDEARALSSLPGGVEGKIVKPDFAFGFPDFVTGDKLPEKEKLPQLQRQWADIRTTVELLAGCGIVEISRIEPVLAKQPQAGEQQKDAKSNRRQRRRRDAEEEKPAYTEEKYAIDFRAKPAALVKAVNALATSQRFFVVETLDFAREGDMIGKALGEGDKRGATEQQSSRPRRRRRGDQTGFGEEKPADGAEESDNGVVNDPEKEEPFLVHAVVATYDFGLAVKPVADESAEPAAAEGAAEGVKEEKEGEE